MVHCAWHAGERFPQYHTEENRAATGVRELYLNGNICGKTKPSTPQKMTSNVHALAAGNSQASGSTDVKIHYTGEAEKQLAEFDRQHPELTGRAREVHDQKVREFVQAECSDASRVNVRKTAHTGGIDPNEREHMTVSVKGSKQIKSQGVHIYMDLLKLLGLK